MAPPFRAYGINPAMGKDGVWARLIFVSEDAAELAVLVPLPILKSTVETLEETESEMLLSSSQDRLGPIDQLEEYRAGRTSRGVSLFLRFGKGEREVSHAMTISAADAETLANLLLEQASKG